MIGFLHKIKRRSQHLRAINNKRERLWRDVIKIENRDPRTMQEMNTQLDDYANATCRYTRHMNRYAGYYGLGYVLFNSVWTTSTGVE